MRADAQPVKILVADDSAVYRKLVEQTLCGSPHQLLFAKTGQETIELFAHHNPPIVIVDWVMPDRTGIEICHHIRASAQSSYTYIIILTGKSEKERVIEGLKAGADDYLTKPFHDGELVARVGVGLRIIELHRQIAAKNTLLAELALTDSLTGLPNRRAIDEWAARQLSGAARYKFSFWVAVADLDNFKSINDAYGHDAGDTVIKKFAQILKANSRRSDICGRMGGEEFLIVLTHASDENAAAAVDRIRNEFAGTKFVFDGGSVQVTASFGLAGFVGSRPPAFGSLVAQADVALYKAKHLGRNRIEISSPMLV
jgi:diguanylate cyclase (GGDEF)-like protein